MNNTTLMKVLRHAWMIATGLGFSPLLWAAKKEIRTNVVKRALKRNFALHQLSHVNSPDLVRSRCTDKRLRIIYSPTLKEHWNY